MKRKVLAILMALVMVVSIVPTNVIAQTTEGVDGTDPVPVCGQTEHTHSEECGATENVCGLAVHTHEGSCYNTEEDAAASEMSGERVCQEGCVLSGEEEHQENGGECLVWLACTKTAGCELSDGHEGDCSGIGGYADTEYTVTFTAKQGNSSLRMVGIMITDASDNTVGYVTTNDRGSATIDLPDGTYTATISYTSGNYVYEAEQEFTVSGNAMKVELEVSSTPTDSYAQSIYSKTTYFDHVDIRVKGTFTTGTSDDLTTYNIKLQNVSIVIDNPDVAGYQDYTQSFSNNSETYEWRKTGIKVHKQATVSLVCDIIDSTTGETLKNGFTHTFAGEADFLQAIKNCDANQGLDFIIDPLEIIEAITHQVSYQWKVVNADDSYSDLPANIATLPSTTTGYESGDTHTIDTIYHEGTYVIVESADGTTATAYQFYGWDWWSHESDNNLTQNTVGSSETALTITGDTIIFGVWRTFELEKATSHLTITKAFSGNEGNLPNGYTVTVTGPLGGDYDIPLSMFTLVDGVYTYNMPVYNEGIFTIKEVSYTIGGYELDRAVVTVTDSSETGHEHLTEVADSNTGTGVQVEVELHWQEAGTEGVSTIEDTQHDYLGTVDFTNTYTKNTGDDIYNLPNLRIDKMDAADRSVLEGATFELQDADGNVVVNGDGIELVGVSDESGYVYFYNIPVDTTAEETVYYLVETDAPDGYVKGYAQYKVVITEKEDSPTEILQDGTWHKYHSYDMAVWVNLGNGWFESQHFSLGTTGNRFRLEAFNFKIDGQLVINKTFTGFDSGDDVYPDAIIVRVQGESTGYDENVTIYKDPDTNTYSTTLTGLELDTYYVNETGIVIDGETIGLDGGEYAIPGYFFDGVTYQAASKSAAVSSARGNAVTLSEADLVEGEDYVASVSMALTNKFIRLEDDAYVWPVLEILKQRDSNGVPIQGVEFTLYYGGSVFMTATSGYNGKAIFNFADKATELQSIVESAASAGDITFTLKETRAADGYAENTTTYAVVLHRVSEEENLIDGEYLTEHTYFVKVNGKEATSTTTYLTVKNTKNVGDLTIIKEFGVNNAYIPAAIIVAISGPNDYSEEITLSADDGWKATLSGLALGEYTATEVYVVLHDDTRVKLEAGSDAALSFVVNGTTYYFNPSRSVTTSTVELTSEKDVLSAELTNTFSREVVNPASFQVKKIDENGEILGDATFALYDDAACEGTALLTEHTGSDGVATFTGFTEAGTYYLQETAAPAGYYLDDTIWEVQVTLENGEPTITVNEKYGIWESIFNWIANLVGKENGHWDGTVLTVMNTVNPGLNIVKKDIGTGEPIVGAGFTLYAEQTCTTAIGTELFTDADGKLSLPITTAGTYYLKETTTPTGYLDTAPVYTVKAEAKAKNVTLNGASYSVDEFVVSIDGQNTETIDGVIHYIVENEALMEIKVTKEWDDDSYHARPTSVTAVLKRNGTQVDEVTLDKNNNWTYTWTEVEIDDVTVMLTNKDTWTVEEKDDFSDLGYAAPSYDVEEDAWIITNTRTPNLIDVTVTKEWELNGADNSPEGVKIQLLRNGLAYGDKVTLNADNKWTYTWEELSDVYVWTVQEDSVDGYELTATEEKTSKNGDVEFTFTNTRIINPVEITVTKTWVNGEKDETITFPTSVKVALYRDGKKVETVTLNADNKWTYTWDDLTDEYEWKVDEPSVPSGYIKTIKTTSKETTDGFEYTYAITNTYNSNPKTGDLSDLGLWGMGMIVPAAALFVLMLLGGNKKKGKRA